MPLTSHRASPAMGPPRHWGGGRERERDPDPPFLAWDSLDSRSGEPHDSSRCAHIQLGIISCPLSPLLLG